MERMNEVFELPLSIDRYGMNDAKNKTLINSDDAEEEYLVAAVHAINNVDALADELAAIIADYKINGFVDQINILSAESTLNAYRGAKRQGGAG